jgi:hypothetical protein
MEKTTDKSIISRQKTFNKWWKKHGNLSDTNARNRKYLKKKAQRALILGAKRTVIAYCCSEIEKQTVFFTEKRYNNSKWPELTKEESWTLFKLTNPTYSMRKRLLDDSAENYSRESQLWSNELKELRALREQFGDYTPKKKVSKRPVISYRRKS